MTRQQINLRIGDLTASQIDALIEQTGMTKTQVVTVAIDRMHREEVREKAPNESPGE